LAFIESLSFNLLPDITKPYSNTVSMIPAAILQKSSGFVYFYAASRAHLLD